MQEAYVIVLFLFVLFLLLGTGVWVGLALIGVAYVGMELFTTRPVGDTMATTIWRASSSWTLIALPMFIWMGEILFRTRLSQDMFRGLAPWMSKLPGGLVHTNIVGCTVFAAVSGSSAATLTTVGKMSIPELRSRKYPEHMVIGTLAGAATLGLMIPPSLTLIVYGVTINESIIKLFFAGVMPGLVLAGMFMAYVGLYSIFAKDWNPIKDTGLSFVDKMKNSRFLIPVICLIAVVIGSMFLGYDDHDEDAEPDHVDAGRAHHRFDHGHGQHDRGNPIEETAEDDVEDQQHHQQFKAAEFPGGDQVGQTGGQAGEAHGQRQKCRPRKDQRDHCAGAGGAHKAFAEG